MKNPPWPPLITGFSSCDNYPDTGGNNGTVSFKITDSGMIMHFVAYFVAMALFYWAYRRDNVFYVLISCFSIFMFGVLLEIVQLYLSYRTFNPVDIAANGFGIFFFVIIWMVYWKKREAEIKFRQD